MFRRRRIGRERSGGFAYRRIGLWSLVCLLMLAPGARAAPAATDRFALVMGEAAYSSLPHEPACSISAQAIAARLRALGFDVAAQTDASNGELGAMLLTLARRAASAAPATVMIYFCGRAVEFDRRVFLLPIGAVLARPSDVLAEGIPAQSFLDIADRGTRVGLTMLDIYYMGPRAQSAAPAALTTLLAGRALSPGHFVAVASETAAITTATPLAQSLSAALTKPPVDLDDLVAVIRKDLAERGVTFAAAGKGGGAMLIAKAAPPPLPPKPVAPKPVTPSTGPPPAPPAAQPAAPAVSLPAEQQYTVLDRRRIQAALRLLGYYDGMVDGLFGPRTRAAIRRYQRDIGVPVTGTLTPDEANRLLAGLPQTSR